MASGGRSEYYLDCGNTAGSSEGAFLIGEILYERTRGLGVEAIGGPGDGSIPLSVSAMLAYDRRGLSMKSFWVRHEVKNHGTLTLVDGWLPKGGRIVIVDDVLTTGTSALKAIQVARLSGCDVVAVIGLVDRLEGAEELLREYDVDRYEAVFNINDFLGV